MFQFRVFSAVQNCIEASAKFPRVPPFINAHCVGRLHHQAPPWQGRQASGLAAQSPSREPKETGCDQFFP